MSELRKYTLLPEADTLSDMFILQQIKAYLRRLAQALIEEVRLARTKKHCVAESNENKSI